MRAYVTELIGTFFLVLTIGLAVLAGTMAPLAIGATLMVMVYMGGHISGGHYNPAVSIAVFVRGKMPVKDFVPYIVAQCAGSLAAALVVSVILGHSHFAVAPNPTHSVLAWVLVELLFTFALALVVLNVATAEKTQGNSYFGLAIGFTVAAAAAAGGGISGGAYNPAVAIGPALSSLLGGHTDGIKYLWIYLVAPAAGGYLAGMVFRFQNPDSVVPKQPVGTRKEEIPASV